MLFAVVIVHRLQNSARSLENGEGTAAYIYLLRQAKLGSGCRWAWCICSLHCDGGRPKSQWLHLGAVTGADREGRQSYSKFCGRVSYLYIIDVGVGGSRLVVESLTELLSPML